jgi:hypothetical protein
MLNCLQSWLVYCNSFDPNGGPTRVDPKFVEDDWIASSMLTVGGGISSL